MFKKKYKEQELIELIQSKDENDQNKAMRYIIKDLGYEKMAIKIVSDLSGKKYTQKELDDFIGKCLFALYKAIQERRFEAKSRLSTYYHSIVRQQWFKQESKKNRLDIPANPSLYSIEERMELKETLELVKEEIKAMEPKCQTVFRGLLDNSETEELRIILQYENVRSVTNLVYKCRKKLKSRCLKNPEIAAYIKTL